MAEFPALPIFTDAYMADTRHLSVAEHGAYFLLLMTAWRSPDCSLPDDDVLLGRIIGDPRNWHRLKANVMQMWYLEGGRWYQKKLLGVRKSVSAKSEKAKLAAKAKHSKNNNSNHANASSEQMPQSANQNQNHLSKDKSLQGVVRQKKPKIAAGPMLHTEIPKDWGNWAMTELQLPRSIVLDIWSQFRDHWTVGKGKNTKRTEDGWSSSWRNWCRKEYGHLTPAVNRAKPAANRQGVTTV